MGEEADKGAIDLIQEKDAKHYTLYFLVQAITNLIRITNVLIAYIAVPHVYTSPKAIMSINYPLDDHNYG